MQAVFEAISSLVQLYALVCVIYILLSWMPELRYSAFGRLLASICEPFLQLFRRFRFARIGVVDFSPILALGALSVLSMALRHFAYTGRFSVGFVLAGVIQVVWAFFSFMITLILIFLFVRIIYDFVYQHKMRSNFWIMMDNFLNPIISSVSQIFFKRGNVAYRTRIIVSFLSILVLRVGGAILVAKLTMLAVSMPI